MDIRKSEEKLPESLKNLNLNTNRGPKNETLVSAYLAFLRISGLKSKPPSLLKWRKYANLSVLWTLVGATTSHPWASQSLYNTADRWRLLDAGFYSDLFTTKPNLSNIEGETWEELDTAEIGHGGQSLRWLVWPRIDKDSLAMLSSVCPRIVVNPKPSLVAYRRDEVPQEALPNVALDEPFIKDIDPKTWVVTGVVQKRTSFPLSNELPIAEKFRLAYAERDARLAPKRAKNARQQQRRAERDWMMSSDKAKAMFLASMATRSLHKS